MDKYSIAAVYITITKITVYTVH